MIYDGRPEGLTRKGERHLKLRVLEKPTLDEMKTITELPPDAVEQEKEKEGEIENKAFDFHVKQDQIVPLLQILMKRFTIIDMGIEEQSLEKVIQRLYSEEKSEEKSEETSEAKVDAP